MESITATIVDGKFTLPDGEVNASIGLPSEVELPAFCRVQAVATPSKASRIKIEIWLPLDRWNGKFNQAGNGGFGRGFFVPTAFMVPALRRGYAVAGTDMGHPRTSGYDASWALGQPEKLINWAYRANLVTAKLGKRLVASLYGKPAEKSYFLGCSDGGREALVFAQRYPAMFDGIVAGAPAGAFTNLAFDHMWHSKRMVESGLTAAKFPAIQRAAIAACGTKARAGGDLIETPWQCSFDPQVLACPAGQDNASCLTPAQITAVRDIYMGPLNPKTGQRIFPGPFPGSETDWSGLLGSQLGGTGSALFRYMVYGNPKWDYLTADYAEAFAAKAAAAKLIDATDPDLSAFRAHGGKLLLYHGLADATVPAQGTITYYNNIVARQAGGMEATSRFARLFLVPGMKHCIAGDAGIGAFDAMSTLENWVERGTPPERIEGTRPDRFLFLGYNVFDTPGTPYAAPLCPFPKVAVADPGHTAAFRCIAQK